MKINIHYEELTITSCIILVFFPARKIIKECYLDRLIMGVTLNLVGIKEIGAFKSVILYCLT